jgi:hypothetical protein
LNGCRTVKSKLRLMAHSPLDQRMSAPPATPDEQWLS